MNEGCDLSACISVVVFCVFVCAHFEFICLRSGIWNETFLIHRFGDLHRAMRSDTKGGTSQCLLHLNSRQRNGTTKQQKRNEKKVQEKDCERHALMYSINMSAVSSHVYLTISLYLLLCILWWVPILLRSSPRIMRDKPTHRIDDDDST